MAYYMASKGRSSNMELKKATMWLVVDAISGAIAMAGEDGIPSGHLYAMLADKMSLDTYQGVINLLVKGKKITCKNHLLVAIK